MSSVGARYKRRGCCCNVCVFLAMAGVVVLVFTELFQSAHIRATVDSATLSNLTVVVSNASSAAAVVSYHLAVTLSLHNPSRSESVYYDGIGARLRFRGAVLGPAANASSPAEFHQRQKAADAVTLVFDYGGGIGIGGGGGVAGELEEEARGEGRVRLELDVEMRVRYVGKVFAVLRVKRRQKPRRRCALSIPVTAEGRRGRGFGGFLVAGEQCRDM
ncbi:hypothetical protein ACP4OV_003199 [Aristida adscensionis]